ncbi:alpha-L-rhamnosidase C-terminal domain-containing protein [Mediterraneibacter glycyrrhizinilyticus]|uniref:alpha-L-rhamnosidase-related protein n=1 Tax=Mediterraneibacter glycyrrhizinilyticus TaxID=342942 RepID=UPI001FB03BAB|nr:alpha-L-rhamnosidase C-terminal domain-containing protein [Mediterraneibacter glycyrrhizinilyticus]
MRTGFVGTPYLLHVLSSYGHGDMSYSLLLRREYPSWLYSVDKGATTIWEHWDGIMENGEFWSTDMNSFNHYAYGSVADWIYESAAGIRPELPGFEKALIMPDPDPRMGWLDVQIETRHGKIRSAWICTEDGVRYEITAEMPFRVVIGETEKELDPGTYTFWS